MASARKAFTLNDELAQQARTLGVNVSAARRGVADAVTRAQEDADRDAYVKNPESADPFWQGAEAWGTK